MAVAFDDGEDLAPGFGVLHEPGARAGSGVFALVRDEKIDQILDAAAFGAPSVRFDDLRRAMNERVSGQADFHGLFPRANGDATGRRAPIHSLGSGE